MTQPTLPTVREQVIDLLTKTAYRNNMDFPPEFLFGVTEGVMEIISEAVAPAKVILDRILNANLSGMVEGEQGDVDQG